MTEPEDRSYTRRMAVGLLKCGSLTLTLGILLFHSSTVSAACNTRVFADGGSDVASYTKPEPSPLLQELFGPEKSISAQFLENWPHRLALGKISTGSSWQQRWDLIKNFPLKDLVAKPGHRILRNRGNIDLFAQKIRENQFPPATEPSNQLSINIVIDSTGQVTNVDCWDGHHRMLARIKAGAVVVGDLPTEELRIFVNGWETNGMRADFKIAATGPDYASSAGWVPIQGHDRGVTYRNRPHTIGKPFDIIADGANSNYRLGSRETLGMVLANMEQAKTTQVGVVHRIGEGLPTLQSLLKWEKQGYQQVVAVNDAAPYLRGQLERRVTRLNQQLTRSGSSIRLHLYVGIDWRAYEAQYTRATFLLRIQQAFATITPVLELP